MEMFAVALMARQNISQQHQLNTLVTGMITWDANKTSQELFDA
jgi:hypothetical protein